MADRDERIIERVRRIDDIDFLLTVADIFSDAKNNVFDTMRRSIEADTQYADIVLSIVHRGHVCVFEAWAERHIESHSTSFCMTLRDGGEAGGAP